MSREKLSQEAKEIISGLNSTNQNYVLLLLRAIKHTQDVTVENEVHKKPPHKKRILPEGQTTMEDYPNSIINIAK